MYIYEVKNVGLVGLFLFSDQLETEVYEDVRLLRKDLNPSLIKIEDGQIRIIRELKCGEYEGEFQDKETGRKYMKLSVDGIHRTVYFDQFYSFPYTEVLRLYSEGKKVCNDLLLSCFLKQTEKIAAIVPLRMRDFLVAGMFSTTSDNFQNVLCVPVEDEQYKKESWYYKMTFSPAQEQMKLFAASMTTYTDDICSLINQGNIKLVDKSEYVAKLNEAMQQTLEKLNKKNIFKQKVKGCKKVDLPAIAFNGITGYSAVQANLLDEEIACIVTDEFVA